MMKHVTARSMSYVAYFTLLSALILTLYYCFAINPGESNMPAEIRIVRVWESSESEDFIKLPVFIYPADTAETSSITASLSANNKAHSSLVFFSDAPCVSVQLDENTIYEYEAGSLVQPTDRWHVIELPGHLSDNLLTISVRGSARLMITPVYIGTSNEVVSAVWHHRLPVLLLDFALLICGAVMLIVSLLARRQWMQPQQRYWVEYAYLWHLGLFLIAFSGWLLCRGEIVHFIFPQQNIVTFLQNLLYLVFPPIFLPHFRQLFIRNRRWIIDITFLVLISFYAVAFILYCFNIASLTQLHLVMSVLLVFAMGWIFGFFVFLRKKHEQPSWGMRFATFLILPVSICMQFGAERFFGLLENDYKSIILAVGMLIYCGFVASFTAERATSRVNEIAETNELLLQSKISLMLGQIRSHFIFNVLNSISTLCTSNPIQAQSVIKRFSDYLRHNINALEQKGNLPFERELAFIESYVDLEILRFGTRIEVVYDIQTTAFTIPLLTIQPIVENAIRHGLCNKREGGTVWIKTYSDDEHFYVEVADNGIGFAYTSRQAKSHKSIAIDNITLRIESIAGGTMTISDREGGGTCVMVVLPIERREETSLS